MNTEKRQREIEREKLRAIIQYEIKRTPKSSDIEIKKRIERITKNES